MGVALSMAMTILALALTGLAIPRHHGQAFGRPAGPDRARMFALAAAVMAAAAPVPWAAERGAAMGLVTWLFCATPLAGLVVAAMFTWLDSRRRSSSAD